MAKSLSNPDALLAENAELRARLEEAEEALHAIRTGEVDALVVEGAGGPQLFTLQGAEAESNRLRGEWLNQVSDAVIVVDDEQRVTFLNAAAERQYGVVAAEVLGLRAADIFQTRWPDAHAQSAAESALRETGEWRGETIHITRDGRELHVESTVSRLHGGDGKHPGLLAVIRDVTARARAERALREAKEAAEAANRSKDRFLAVLSHELRTPLTPVLMTVSALEHDPTVPAEVREDLTMIKRNVELETRLIDDLLDVSRIASGKLVLELAPIDLNEAVRRVCDNCQAQARERGVRLAITLDERTGTIAADSARLQQVLWNVLRNAMKFTPEGGSISVRTARRGSDRCEVRVRDSGIGIAPEALPLIFEVFEQGAASVTRQFGGLGLGLAICKALMEAHGGSIRAESAGVSQGSTFILEFPARSAALAAATPDSTAAAAAGRAPIRVLLVEDHVDTARTLERLLRRAGLAVTHATDVAKGVAAAAQGTFDVIVSDLGLPDGTGCELMERVRATRPLPGIAMSGYGMPEDTRRTREAGFSEHLVKPIEVPQLIAAIRRVVEVGA
jgi:PAS domain S-box-containing protein